MNDMKKVLIAAISVVLVIAIVAGVSIGVLAGTVNGMKDQIAELGLTVESLESQNAAMKAEIEEATANNENLVTAADFEAKLAEALGTQTQTMQALISTAVKNQIDELGVEGLTEEQVNEIIDAAVANCITEDEIDAIIADAETGLTKDEVKKLINSQTAGYLTYAQIVNLIEDESYNLRKFLEDKLETDLGTLGDEIQKGQTLEVDVDTSSAVNGVVTIDDEILDKLVSGGTIQLKGDWSDTELVITYDAVKNFDLVGGTDSEHQMNIKMITIEMPESEVGFYYFNFILDDTDEDGVANIRVKWIANNSLVLVGCTINTIEVENGHVEVGEGTTVENVTLSDGDNKLTVTESAKVNNVTVENTDGATEIISENSDTKVTVATGDDATVTVTGTVDTVTVNSGSVTLSGEDTTVSNVVLGGDDDNDDDATVTVASGASVENITVDKAAGSVTITSDEESTIPSSVVVEQVPTTEDEDGNTVVANGSINLGGTAATDVTIKAGDNVDEEIAGSLNDAVTVVPDASEDEDIVITVARVGTEDELVAALENDNIVTIVVYQNFTVENTIVINKGKSLVIDLKDYTLSGDVHKTVGPVIENNGDLTISNGAIQSIAGNGGSAIGNNGNLVLEDCNLVGAPQTSDDELTTNKWPSYPLNHYAGDLTINGGSVTGIHGAISVSKGATATINDVEVTVLNWGSSCHVFYSGGDVTVNGGVFNHQGNGDGSVAYVYGGTMTINDGTFTGKNGGYGVAAGGGHLTIKGGTFNNNIMSWGGEIEITGGKFLNSAVEDLLTDDYDVSLAGGYYYIVPAGYAVASSNTELDAALTNGATNIILCADVTANVCIPGGSNITIVGASDDITISGQIATTSSTAGTLTIKNCIVNVDSAIEDSTGISQTGKSAIALWGNQTVICENVTFNMSLADSSAISGWWDTDEGTTIIVKNCTFNCNGQRPLRTCGNITVENCTFNDPYRYAIQLTAKTSTATLMENAIVNFNNNTINNGENGKAYVYGIQLEGETYGCHDLIINGEGNVINAGEWDTNNESTMYYCECGKVDHNTIEWNTEVAPVHAE